MISNIYLTLVQGPLWKGSWPVSNPDNPNNLKSNQGFRQKQMALLRPQLLCGSCWSTAFNSTKSISSMLQASNHSSKSMFLPHSHLHKLGPYLRSNICTSAVRELRKRPNGQGFLVMSLSWQKCELTSSSCFHQRGESLSWQKCDLISSCFHQRGERGWMAVALSPFRLIRWGLALNIVLWRHWSFQGFSGSICPKKVEEHKIWDIWGEL